MAESTRPHQDPWPAPQLRDCVQTFLWEPADDYDPDWFAWEVLRVIKPKAWQRVVAK